MKKVLCFFAVLAAMLLAGCVEDGPRRVEVEVGGVRANEAVAVGTQTQRPLMLELNTFELLTMRNGIERRKFEPESGIYLGAYIQSDRTVRGVAEFEQRVGVEHAIFAYNMTAGGEFPFMFVLELASLHKTPLITVEPADRFAPFDINNIRQTAEDAGRFNLPIFINLYPVSRGMSFNAVEYVAFFRQARNIFAEYAPNAAVIWSVHFEDVFTSDPFYPGSGYVDWVGISAFSDISPIGEHIDVMRHINHLYFRYQRDHPMIITQLGISYFTTDTFTFHTRQAAAEIERVYNAVAANFPRIKAIVYASFDNTDFAAGRGLNNYRITGEAPLIESYARAASGARFISVLDEDWEGRRDVITRSPFSIIEKDGAFFLPKNALIFDLELTNLSRFDGAEMLINNEPHFSLRLLRLYENIEFFVNHETGTVIVFGNE